jgi:GntR family transcriptional regulator/MocR family aminotransferase
VSSWTLLIELDRESTEPLYLQIVRAVTEGVRKGRLRPGEALPGTRALAESLGVNRNTTLAAYQELEAEGWVVSEADRGTFVAEAPPRPFPRTEGSVRAEDSGSWTAPTPLSEPFYQPQDAGEEGFRLIPELPDVRLAPTLHLQRAHGRVLNLHTERILQPAWDPRGLLELRVSLCKMLRDLRGLSVDPGNLVLTRGLMSTLTLISRVLFQAGDAVVVEDPGYFRVAESFVAAGARILPVPVDAQGMVPEALEAVMAQQPVRLISLTASPQYPTYAVLSSERRKRILDLARRHGARILEGDLALGFHRERQPSLPLASDDAEGTVVYFSALDQILAPGMQVGFLAAAGPLAKTLAKQRQLVDWPGNQLQEATIEELFRDTEIQRHLSRVRKITDERRESMVDRLLFHLHPALQVENPRQGLSLWVKVAEDIPVDAWVERCAARGVIFYPGRLYDFHRRPLPFACMGFAAHDASEQNEACLRMAEAVKEVRRT